MSETAKGQEGGRADVELRLPADGAFVSVLRTTTAGLAARLDFTIDDIEDLRIAVSEASAMVLPAAAPDSDLTCRFFMRPGALTVSMTVPADGPVDRLDQADGADLHQVLERLTAVAEPAGAVLDQRQVEVHQGVAGGRSLRLARLRVDQGREQCRAGLFHGAERCLLSRAPEICGHVRR